MSINLCHKSKNTQNPSMQRKSVQSPVSWPLPPSTHTRSFPYAASHCPCWDSTVDFDQTRLATGKKRISRWITTRNHAVNFLNLLANPLSCCLFQLTSYRQCHQRSQYQSRSLRQWFSLCFLLAAFSSRTRELLRVQGQCLNSEIRYKGSSMQCP